MFRSLIAMILLATPAAAVTAQADNDGQWSLAGFPSGCMVHAASPQGTVLSIWGFAGKENLGFLVQNKKWGALKEGERHNLKVAFDHDRAWPVQATARRDIDADGPGLFFSVKPSSQSDQAGFVESFASARGMDISREGKRVDILPLSGSHDAMSALAGCMSGLWESVRLAQEQDEQQSEPQDNVPPLPTT